MAFRCSDSNGIIKAIKVKFHSLISDCHCIKGFPVGALRINVFLELCRELKLKIPEMYLEINRLARFGTFSNNDCLHVTEYDMNYIFNMYLLCSFHWIIKFPAPTHIHLSTYQYMHSSSLHYQRHILSTNDRSNVKQINTSSFPGFPFQFCQAIVF